MRKRLMVFWGVIVAISIVLCVIYIGINRKAQKNLKEYHPVPSIEQEVQVGKGWQIHHCPEYRIAGFDLSEHVKTFEKDVVGVYGNGCVGDIDGEHNKSFRYYLPASKLFVELEFEQSLLVNVRITQMEIAERTCLAKKEFSPVITGKGLEIGDSKERVKKYYGEPAETRDVPNKPGQYYMVYSDEATFGSQSKGVYPGHAMYVTINKEKVVSMEIITGE